MDYVKGVNYVLELKFGYVDENLDEMYVGFFVDDFKKIFFFRYVGL